MAARRGRRLLAPPASNMLVLQRIALLDDSAEIGQPNELRGAVRVCHGNGQSSLGTTSARRRTNRVPLVSRSSSGLGSSCRDQVFGGGELPSENNAGLRRQPTDRSDVIVHAIEDPV